MWIGHCKGIPKLEFWALALCRSWIRSDEGLTLETSAIESLHGFTAANYLVMLPADAAPQFL